MTMTIVVVNAAALLHCPSSSIPNLNDGCYHSDPPWGLDRTVISFHSKMFEILTF